MKHCSAILTLCLLVTIVPVTHADDAAVRTQIVAFYAKKDAAERTNNYAAWKTLAQKYVLPSFTLTDSAGKVTSLPKLLVQLKAEMKSGTLPTVDKTTILSLTVKGQTATEISTNDYASPNKTNHIYAEHATQSVKWVKINGVWKAASVTITSVKKSLDGKPFPTRHA